MASFPLYQNRLFRDLWVATFLSNLGVLIQGVGAAWLMTSLSNSTAMVAMVQSSTTLPMLLLALLGGVVADGFDRRWIMLVAQLFRFFVSIVLVVVVWFGVITPQLLLIFTFLIGCGVALNFPAWQASVGDIVPRAELRSAVAANSVGFNLSRSAGPALGGLIVATSGVVVAFVVNAASYIMLLVVLWRWTPEKVAEPLPREPIGAAMRTGLRYVALSPEILKVLLRSLAFGLGAAAVPALLPVVVVEQLGDGPFLYGMLLAAFGLGAVGGAAYAKTWQDRVGIEIVTRLSFLGFAVCAIVTGLSSSVWLTGIAQVIGGCCWVLAFALFNATIQLSTPRWVVGRVLSVFQTVTFGSIAIGSWIWGIAAESWNLAFAHELSGLLMLVGAVLGLIFPLPRQANSDVDTSDLEDMSHIEPLPDDLRRPVHIEITYRIDDKDLSRFFALMVERKRLRQRDGARHWLLLRDLTEGNCWSERYSTSNWADYVRHNLRQTKSAAMIQEQIMALHQGDVPPFVRRHVESAPTPLRLQRRRQRNKSGRS